jgi:hypothetical protein
MMSTNTFKAWTRDETARGVLCWYAEGHTLRNKGRRLLLGFGIQVRLERRQRGFSRALYTYRSLSLNQSSNTVKPQILMEPSHKGKDVSGVNELRCIGMRH